MMKRTGAFLAVMILYVTASTFSEPLTMLKTQNGKIVNEKGMEVFLKGVNLGGWLLWEGHIFGWNEWPQYKLINWLVEQNGEKKTEEFIGKLRETFLTRDDMKAVHDMGFNLVRLLFNYRIFEDDEKPFAYKKEGFEIIDRALSWCKEFEMYCMIDFHAAPGAQSPSAYADSVEGSTLLWTRRKNRERFVKLWAAIAERYKDRPEVGGYDLLNEPAAYSSKKVADLYRETLAAIRKHDKKHIVFLEGDLWASVIATLESIKDDNMVYSFHYYTPWIPGAPSGYVYPGKKGDYSFGPAEMEKAVSYYAQYAKERNIPLICSEFGTWEWKRGGVQWTKDMVSLFKKYNIHYLWWSYKTLFPSSFGVVYRDKNDAKSLSLDEMIEAMKLKNLIWRKDLISALQ